MTRRERLALAAQFVVAVVVMFALWGSILALAYLFDAIHG